VNDALGAAGVYVIQAVWGREEQRGNKRRFDSDEAMQPCTLDEDELLTIQVHIAYTHLYIGDALSPPIFGREDDYNHNQLSIPTLGIAG
jgi:hypothetical protein